VGGSVHRGDIGNVVVLLIREIFRICVVSFTEEILGIWVVQLTEDILGISPFDRGGIGNVVV